MTEVAELRERLATLELRIQRMVAVIALSGLAILLSAAHSKDILRVRGIVILDDAGHERIVLGAPLRGVSSDTRLAATVGMVVVDSLGKPGVAVGANTPAIGTDGLNRRRIASNMGMTFYDMHTGGERGGVGTLFDGRANACLDYSTGKEATCMSVAPKDQNSSVMLQGTPNEPQFDRVGMFLSADGTGVLKAFGGGANESGLMARVGKGKPQLIVVDSTQNVVKDLANAP